MFVTGSERNLVRQLDGQPAFEVLRELVDGLSPADLELARQSLFAGLVMRRNREQYGPGDFLIRNLIGVDPESGVGWHRRPGRGGSRVAVSSARRGDLG